MNEVLKFWREMPPFLDLIVCTSLSAGGLNLQNFKKGGLTTFRGPQLLDESCWKEEGDFFQGVGEGGYNLHTQKKKLTN